MKKTISIIRIGIILALGLAAILLVFNEEQDSNPVTLTLHILADKALGIGACLAMARLYRRWSKIDPWLKAYDKMCVETAEKPMYSGNRKEDTPCN